MSIILLLLVLVGVYVDHYAAGWSSMSIILLLLVLVVIYVDYLSGPVGCWWSSMLCRLDYLLLLVLVVIYVDYRAAVGVGASM